MGLTRKRRGEKDMWEKTKAKTERYKAKGLPKKPNCNHGRKKHAYHCSDLSLQDVRRFHQNFYKTHNKTEQDNFILKHTKQVTPKTRRGSAKQPKVSTQYFVNTLKRGHVQVCAKAFLSMLSISKYRVQNIARRYHLDGETPKERRGGDTQSAKFQGRREAVRSFIQQLPFVESHYTREKSCRKYLPSDNTVKKLWRAFNNKVDHGLKVKYIFFLRVFNYDFNISFKSPATDACSECIRLKTLIPVTTPQSQKQEHMTRLTVHKMKYRTFYNMLKQDEGPTVLKLSFDCQKNLVLPRIPDQAAYYSRQLYVYNFTICVGHSKAHQYKGSVFTYAWCENERFKGSNEIASILYYHLQNTDMTGIKEIKLFCDGCPGQNKTVTVLGMLCRYLFECVNEVHKIQITFPVVGHSFIPPDRVFGRIEKEIRKKDTIIEPQEYLELFALYGTVRKVGSEVPIADWKTAVNFVLKTPAQFHFKFSTCKRIILEKNARGVIRVQGEAHYRNDLCEPKTIQKKREANKSDYSGAST